MPSLVTGMVVLHCKTGAKFLKPDMVKKLIWSCNTLMMSVYAGK
jgi:hypothetical protein